MAKSTSENAAEPGFEAILKRLEDIVQKLESDQPSLDDSLALFEEGMVLARKGESVLASAEARIEKVLAVGQDGSVDSEPLPPME